MHSTLEQVFGYPQFRPGQEAAVSAVLAGRSAAAIFPTGSGKSLCYQLPAVLLPHGGPSARDEWGFDWLAQYLANQGYAVLQPNYRGSAGYGDAWLQRNGFQGWRTSIGDVTDGARWLVAQGIADADRLAIVGWSYGGYAALQAGVTEPGLFKALVAIAMWGAGAIGFLITRLNLVERVVAIGSASLLVVALPLTDELGLGLIAVFIVWHVWRSRAH